MSKVKVLSLITVSGLFLMAGNLSASADVVTSGGDTIMLSGVDAGVSDSITPPPSNINPVTDTIEPSAPTPSTDPITDTTAPSAPTPSTDQTTVRQIQVRQHQVQKQKNQHLVKNQMRLSLLQNLLLMFQFQQLQEIQ